MAGTTARGLHSPVGADPVEPATGTTAEKNAKPTDVGLLAGTVNDHFDEMFQTGTRAARPSSAPTGAEYFAEDSVALFKYYGGWQRLSIPAGAVLATGTPAAPAGYVPAKGGAFSRTGATQDLWEAIGGLGSLGDGSTTFTVPNVQGRTMIGEGTGPGTTAKAAGVFYGTETHQLSLAEIPSHTHNIEARGSVDGSGSNVRVIAGVHSSATGVDLVPTLSAGGSGGVTVAHNNIQPSIGMYFYFKL